MLIIDQSLQGVVPSFHYETKGICLKALIDGIETEGMFRGATLLCKGVSNRRSDIEADRQVVRQTAR